MDAAPISPSEHRWLEHQTRLWEGEGLISPESGEAIRGRYTLSQRLALTRLVIYLGAAFVIVGLIWLVASNLDQFTPLGRFALVAAIWLALMIGAEVLDQRTAPTGGSIWVGLLRVLGSGTFGAVVFQAAQSLQVPTYASYLVGVWALGALVHAYAVRSLAVLAPAVPLALFWVFWQVLGTDGRELRAALGMALAGAVGAIAGALHERSRPTWDVPWVESGASAALAAVFLAGSPTPVARGWAPWLIAQVVGVIVILGALAVRAGRNAQLSLVIGVLGLAIAAMLASWPVGEWHGERGGQGGAVILRACVAVAVFLVLATAVAVLGVLRESQRLTVIATAALVLFVTVQAFGVFAPIFSGAALFLTLGLVLLATGYLADRGRRTLVADRGDLA